MRPAGGAVFFSGCNLPLLLPSKTRLHHLDVDVESRETVPVGVGRA